LKFLGSFALNDFPVSLVNCNDRITCYCIKVLNISFALN
jgi:hypothetical protein